MRAVTVLEMSKGMLAGAGQHAISECWPIMVLFII